MGTIRSIIMFQINWQSLYTNVGAVYAQELIDRTCDLLNYFSDAVKVKHENTSDVTMAAHIAANVMIVIEDADTILDRADEFVAGAVCVCFNTNKIYMCTKTTDGILVFQEMNLTPFAYMDLIAPNQNEVQYIRVDDYLDIIVPATEEDRDINISEYLHTYTKIQPVNDGTVDTEDTTVETSVVDTEVEAVPVQNTVEVIPAPFPTSHDLPDLEIMSEAPPLYPSDGPLAIDPGRWSGVRIYEETAHGTVEVPVPAGMITQNIPAPYKMRTITTEDERFSTWQHARHLILSYQNLIDIDPIAAKPFEMQLQRMMIEYKYRNLTEMMNHLAQPFHMSTDHVKIRDNEDGDCFMMNSTPLGVERYFPLPMWVRFSTALTEKERHDLIEYNRIPGDGSYTLELHNTICPAVGSIIDLATGQRTMPIVPNFADNGCPSIIR